MWRVSQCSCGCSLRTGTLILLWFDLMNRGLTLPFAFSALSSVITEENRPNQIYMLYLVIFVLAIQLIGLTIVILAFLGAIRRLPAFILPYLIVNMLGLILSLLVFCVSVCVSLVWSDEIINTILKYDRGSHDHPHSSQMRPEERDSFRQTYNGIIITSSVIWLLGFSLSSYFLCVIYSYYKQMQEEGTATNNRSTRVVYSAPRGQPGVPGCRPQPIATLYPQLPPGYLPQYAPDPNKL